MRAGRSMALSYQLLGHLHEVGGGTTHRLLSTLEAAMNLLKPTVAKLISSAARCLVEFGPDYAWVTVVSVLCRISWSDTDDSLGGLQEGLGCRHAAVHTETDVDLPARCVDGAIEIVPAPLSVDVGSSAY